MVAPLVYPVAVLVVGGVIAAGKGATDWFQGKSMAKEAKGRHDVAVEELDGVQRVTHEMAEKYGRSQLGAQRDTIGRFADWLENHSHLVERLDRRTIDGVEVTVPSIR